MNLDDTELSGTLAQRLRQQLQEAIVEGEIAPGSKLSEASLARTFGTSRGPLREAIRGLQARGLVEATPHAGARVVSLNERQLLEIYEARESAEGMAARLAAERMSSEQIASLSALLDTHKSEIEAADGQSYRQSEGDLDFHYRLAEGCGNSVLTNLLCEDLYHLMRMYRRQFSSAPGRPERALAEHRQILGAIEDRDGELAELLMRKHIRKAKAAISANTVADTLQPADTPS